MSIEEFGRCRRLPLCGLGLAAVGVALGLTGCGGNYSAAGPSQPPTPTYYTPPGGGGTGGGTGAGSTVTKVIPAGGSTIVLPLGGASALDINFPAGAVPAGTSVTATQVPQASLPVSLAHARIAHAARSPITGRAQPRFTANPNNVYVAAFQISATGVSVFNVPVNVTGGNAVAPTSLPANTVLNVATLQNGTYVDVATVTTNAAGGLTQQQASAALAGITGPGTYVIYEPAQGTSTTVANFGVALIADDGNGPGEVQVVNLLDSSGNPLATPTLTSLPFPNAFDLDGEALTPDGTQGILVDGGNTVRFFSGVNSGVPLASTNTLDITNYGGDGNSVAILPNGAEAVVSGDDPQNLLLVSGILGGSPQPAETIAIPGNRDGLVISNDGKVLLARGPAGLTVFAIAPTASAAGPLGGSVAHTFTQVTDLPALGSAGEIEDGREGMALSPTDSSRAVVIGDATGAPSVSLLTGLTGTPAVSSLRLRLPASQMRHFAHRSEKRAHPRLTLTGVGFVTSVAVTTDGKSAIVGTDAGLVLVSGVDTGTLAQVGTPFNPTFTVSGTGYTLAGIPTLGLTLDGKYVVALTPQPSSSSGTLLLIPIQSGGFGAPVGHLSGLAIPDNDQILIH